VGILRGKAAVPDLVEALRSKDDRLMLESLTALEKIRDPESAPKIAFLLRDLNEKIQIAAIETTGLLRNREALPQLRSALDNARSVKVRRAALSAIAMIPEESSRTTYSRYISDKDPGLRAAAAEGFARLENPSDLPMLEKEFNAERSMSPRLSLAFALVMNKKTDMSEFSPLQYLINTLNSSAWRGVARAFLTELARKPEVLRAVEQAAKNGTRGEKVEVSGILAASGDKDSLAFLDALSRDGDSEVSGAALNALRTLKARL
jgi:HEAT repeat protein